MDGLVSVPVLLLTGYLGSGKTTLLNRILGNGRGVRFAVIVNDLGEVNIDADLVERGGVVGRGDESLVALQNGCICCTLQMDLVEQLRGIVAQGRFDYIVIEASGVCEPAPIAQTICSIPRMEERFWAAGVPRLDCVVTVVDALRMRDEFGLGEGLRAEGVGEDDVERLVVEQIEFCNIVLLNKAAEVGTEELRRVREVVRALQPRAEIVECNYGDVPLERLLHTGLFDFDRVATSAAWIDAIEGDGDVEEEHGHHHDEEDGEDECGHCHGHHDGDGCEDGHHDEGDECEHGHHGDGEGHSHHHHHHHHHGQGETEEYGVGTWVYFARRPLNLGRFDDFVARLWPKNIIRAKGICWFEGEEDVCYLFEQAGKQFSLKNCGQWYATMPREELDRLLEAEPKLRRDWDERYGDRMQKLVFIGQGMDEGMREYLREVLDGCLAEG